jgi:hypothetical protein
MLAAAGRTLKALGGGKAQEVEVGAVALGGAGRRLKLGRSGAWRRKAHVEGGALWARRTSKAGRCGQGAHVEGWALWRQGAHHVEERVE